MEYTVHGIIEFYATNKIKLGEKLDFASPSGARVGLHLTNDGDIAVEIILEADSAVDAKAIAEIELNRICDLLSYFHNIPISGNRITGMVTVSMTSEGRYIKTEDAGVGIDAILSFVKGPGPESMEELGHQLEKEYSSDFGNIVFMWREAISTEASALKYLLLYRLMEFLFRSNTEQLTNWIKTKETSVQIFHDRQRGDTTIYTYLRDSIHPKQKRFPLQDINNLLPGLQSLAKEAIREKFGYNCAS